MIAKTLVSAISNRITDIPRQKIPASVDFGVEGMRRPGRRSARGAGLAGLERCGGRCLAGALLLLVGSDAGEDHVGGDVVAAAEREVDVAEALLLVRAQVALLHHLEQRDQRADQAVTALGAVED